MDFLTLRVDNSDPEKLANESNETYDFITSIAEEEEPRALAYFDRQWCRTKEHSMKLYRDEGDATNNVSESHFHQIKQTFVLGKKNERIDDIFITLVTVVIPNFTLKVQISNALHEERYVRILSRAGNQIVEQRASKFEECMNLINQIKKLLQIERVEPNVVLPSLKAVANLAERNVIEE
ncbi:hypothetical protein TVAG_356430 [Trichomonas vaginalis G3]|uniref:Uncharacterized protein n=1 Tax=Trichomonas vaginalis (strain ATCC PRA-98 / G3) TaxID=412133 RepID=A2FM62_TRIV3|nr:hypothetical protein TVAG_356430 [Trichomonas vaginalis G3]|eukprot:XP_001306926.1 hypothetical protein [Trichomonas vaginalis G3]